MQLWHIDVVDNKKPDILNVGLIFEKPIWILVFTKNICIDSSIGMLSYAVLGYFSFNWYAFFRK